MNQTEARKVWVEALRSGEYKQGRRALRMGDRFCCLGVACDLYRKHEGGPEWSNPFYNGSRDYMSHGGDLPKAVINWLGIRHADGSNGLVSLANLNDRGNTFKEIAGIIESASEGRFHEPN